MLFNKKQISQYSPHNIYATVQLNVLLSVQEENQTVSSVISTDNQMIQAFELNYLKKSKSHRYKVQYLQELSGDDSHARVEFCEKIMNICINDNQLLKELCS